MIISPKNLVRHELTGLEVEVVSSTDPQKTGIKGKVTGETKNLIKIETASGEKNVPKAECVFRFSLATEKVDVTGKKLVGRPEDRIKK